LQIRQEKTILSDLVQTASVLEVVEIQSTWRHEVHLSVRWDWSCL